MGRCNRKAQSTGEYAIIIGLVVGVLIAMQTYVRRGIQARSKDATDSYVASVGADTYWSQITSTQADLESQYEHNKLSSKRTSSVLDGTETTEKMTAGGEMSRDITEITTRGEGDYHRIDY